MAGGKISVIIPCYNVEKQVRDCLDSILGQSIGAERLELILIDDASTDGTVEILREYEQKYPENIMLILCEKNGRQGTARNIGLKYATGEYISFVDSDDWIHPDAYKVLVKISEKNDCDIVQFRYRTAKDISEMDASAIDDVTCVVYDYADNRKSYLLNSSVLNESCWSKLYRREIIDKSGVRYAQGVSYEEPLFTYPLKFYVNRVAVTEQPLYYYRYNYDGTMLSYMNKPSAIVEHLQVQQEVYLWMQNTEFMEEYKDEIDLYFIHSFYMETFYFIAVRGGVVPAVMLRYMAKILKSYIPNYLDNPYLADASLAEEITSLKLIENLDLSDEKLDEKIVECMKKLTL